MIPLAIALLSGRVARVVAFSRGGALQRLLASADVAGRVYRYDPTQLRRPKGDPGGGRWTSGAAQGVEVQVRPARAGDRAFGGGPVKLRNSLPKQSVGKVSEAVAVGWLKRNGFPGAHSLNVGRNNFPLDLVDDHQVFEVKGGLASNGRDAQKWRLTIGEPGPREKAWLAKASPRQKAAFNERKMAAIFERKIRAMREVQKRYGKRIIGGKTITVVLHPDKGLADVYRFDGFHASIRWNSPEAKAAYQGTLKWKM